MFVPHYAMSGGTLIALAADEIVMDEHAVLGPGRSRSSDQYPAVSIVAAVERKPIERVSDETLILADMSREGAGAGQGRGGRAGGAAAAGRIAPKRSPPS